MSDCNSDDDDNILLTSTMLNEKTKWENQEILDKLDEQMNNIEKIVYPVISIPREIIMEAINEVFEKAGWSSYDTFKKFTKSILSGTKIPFSHRTKNIKTGKLDFWMTRVFILLEENGTKLCYGEFPKKSVLMSPEFNSCLKEFCEEILKNEARFFIFTGKSLQLNKLIESDKNLLPSQNPKNLVMIQFKLRVPENMIGAKKIHA